MENLIYKEETYKIIGKCMEVYNNLGSGFLEIVYKDAIEVEFKNSNIPYKREVQYNVNYKGVILQHHFFADFIVFDKIILEIKSSENIKDEHIAQTINYLKVSNNKLGVIVNFSKTKLDYKRIIV